MAEHNESQSPLMIKETQAPLMINTNNVEAPESESEPDLIKYNQGKIKGFRGFGLFLIYWKNGKYDASNRMLLLYYIICYLGAIVIFGVAYGFKELFKKENEKDQIDDILEASFVGLILGICPSCWIYLLREFSTSLPLILRLTKKLENTAIYKKLTECKYFSKEVSFMKGFLDDDHTDCDDEVYKETEKYRKEQWWIVKYGPHIGFILSVVICFILVIVSCFWDISYILLQAPGSSLDHLKDELPLFLMSILYPLPCYVSLWFVMFFLEWQRIVYGSIREIIRGMKDTTYSEDSSHCTRLNEESRAELEKIKFWLHRLQKVFILLNKKIFQKTIVIDFILFIFLGVFLIWKMIDDHTNFSYIFPFGLLFGHIYFVCKWSNDLMSEFDEIIEVLNEMHEDDVQELRRELLESPPQVMAFGGFSANYSMMTAVMAFMLSIVSITGMIWQEVDVSDDEAKHCYEYAGGGGEWNYTLCVKQHCYTYQGEDGVWNNTLCLKDKIEDSLFVNGTLSLIPM